MLDHKKIAQEIIRRTGGLRQREQSVRRFFVPALQKLFAGLQVGDFIGSQYCVIAEGSSFSSLKNKSVEEYLVWGVDGSQVYPDPQLFGGDTAIINVGGIQLLYEKDNGFADLFITTEFIVQEEFCNQAPNLVFGPEIIDCIRFLREIECGVGRFLQKPGALFGFLLFDGSMVPQGLMLKNAAVQQFVMKKYVELLKIIREKSIPVCWYTSSPRSLLWATAVEFSEGTDVDLLSQSMSQGEISPVLGYKKNELFGHELSGLDMPVFVYLKMGEDVVKLEFPLWIFEHKDLFERLFFSLSDQVKKGFGYPVALTEAHMHVVVTENDRQLIFALAEQEKGYNSTKNKNFRKKIIPV
ncbi:DNA double-strand break repair nuclease NurA [Candidatus Dependentiae bacterium]|nr:DNA double-strand break repair nuclease NurA [Candidatus Dependentiae bacterium]